MGRAEIRERLETERLRLGHLTGTLSVPNGETGSKAVSGDYGQDAVDMASKTLEQAQDLSIMLGMKAKLADVDRALERLKAGTYGVCEACGQPIAEARLEAWPAARFCRDDQARSERRPAPMSRIA